MPKSQVFISYSRRDGRNFAGWLRQQLEGAGLAIWQDVISETPGEDWWLNITQAIDGAAVMVLVFTEGALRSQVVADEWLYARRVGTPIVPVVLSDDIFRRRNPDGTPIVPRWLDRLDALVLDENGPDFALHWERLLAILLHPPSRHPVPFTAPRLPDQYVPRTMQEVQIMARILGRDGLTPLPGRTALIGAPGFGKSTLAQAVAGDRRQ